MKFLVLMTALFFALGAYAENKITIFVTLSPAGSFSGVSQKGKGNIIKQGEVFTAEKISVSIDSFKTGIELRDEHLWKHMNYTKHPKAIITDLKGQGGKASATLEVNGIKKPVSIAYKVSGGDVLAKFSTKASLFGMSKAEYLGVGVDDSISIEVQMPYKSK